MTEKKKDTAIVRREPTLSEKFTNLVIREFGTTISDTVEMTPYQRHLAQHLFIKIDATLKELDSKRSGDRQPITWNNINMNKLAIDAVHRIDLGLDALIPNHIHPIPYWNSKGGKYDLDLQVGYVGKDFYRRNMAAEQPEDIIYELVYSTDEFEPIKRTLNTPTESYTFKITQPFDRGEIIGGFGYIVYTDTSKNQLVIVTEKDFQKAKALAKTQDFWTRNPVEMRYKTLVHRVTDKLQIDPRKVNESFMAVEVADDERAEAETATQIEEKANKEILDVDMERPAGIELDHGEIVEEQPKAVGVATLKEAKPKRNPASIKTIADMEKACKDDFGLDSAQVMKELNVKSSSEIVKSPWDCYLQIAAVMAGPQIGGEPGF